MSTKKQKFGKPISKVNGFNLRPILNPNGNPSGKIAVVAGKKVLAEFTHSAKGIEEATQMVK